MRILDKTLVEVNTINRGIIVVSLPFIALEKTVLHSMLQKKVKKVNNIY